MKIATLDEMQHGPSLGEIGDARAIKPLSELEQHTKQELQEAVKEALEKIKAKKS